MTMKLLEELGHKHRVLTTRDADSNLISILNQVIFTDGTGKLSPNLLTELLLDGSLHILCIGKCMATLFLGALSLCSFIFCNCNCSCSRRITIFL